MRVGIYNRWLATLGGGEKHSLAIAEYLSQRHSVTIISHDQVPKMLAEQRLNLDLSRVEFIAIPECHPLDMAETTGQYDLFINSSFMDFFPSRAQFSANLVYFPAKIDRSVSVRRHLKQVARRLMKMPSFIAGLIKFNTEEASFRWLTDGYVKIRLPPDPSGYQVTFDLSIKDPGITSVIILLNGDVLYTFSSFKSDQFVHCQVLIPGDKSENHQELILQATGQFHQDGLPKMEISNLFLDLRQFRLYHLFFERGMTKIGAMLNYYPADPSIILSYINTYGMIWANSEFTRYWIQRYWHRHAEVLYPPIDVKDFQVGKKKQQILSVGRFFAGQHNKKHLEMISVFNKMVNLGMKGWELILVGGKTRGAEHEEHLNKILEAARGYPITIHVDIPFQQLVSLYSESAIYWHAAGFGENERQDPVKFEHFGITTVEAMASGCVPVVIGKGAQPEIVKHGQNGFLWQTLENLEHYTNRLIATPDLLGKMSLAAIQSSKRYDKSYFHNRLNELLHRIGFPG